MAFTTVSTPADSQPHDDFDFEALIADIPDPGPYDDTDQYLPKHHGPLVAVAADKYEPGLDADDTWCWPRMYRSRLGAEAAYEVMTLDKAMRTPFNTDAHFVPYILTDATGRVLKQQPRATIDGLPVIRRAGFEVYIAAQVADVDNPGHAKWTDETLRVAKERLSAPSLASTVWYTTRAGLRIIRIPNRWLSIEEHQATLPGWLDEIERATGLVPDRACVDWTRHFRLPRVARDRVMQRPEGQWSWLTYEVGAIAIPEPAPAPAPVVMSERARIAADLRRSLVGPDRVEARAEKYVTLIPTPRCGEGVCEKVAYRAACALTQGFGLPESSAYSILVQWAARGDHKWAKGSLARKVRDAARGADDSGYLLRTTRIAKGGAR